jgi:hypothetical protein
MLNRAFLRRIMKEVRTLKIGLVSFKGRHAHNTSRDIEGSDTLTPASSLGNQA